MKTLALMLSLAAAVTGCTSDPQLDLKDEARRQLADGKADDRDVCEDNGWYHDDVCDQFCPKPDPDCNGQPEHDSCAENGWYDDDVCDTFCPQPDPDCNGGGGGGGSVSCPNDNSCTFAFDNVCDDGGLGSDASVCAPGTDRNDCGFRYGPSCTGTGPTPSVWSAYYQKGDCNGGAGATASLVVAGSGFEIESQSGGITWGTKRRIGSSWPQGNWNRMTSSEACVTVSGPWDAGNSLSMINLGDKESGSVTITNQIPSP